ncbi:gamma-glutamylcyclotransferase [Bacillus cereus group sp. Bc256]|uniref:gamma-glutamylcyclotransferase family protein n=1 Tax=Bacillus cereus group sp. Bc256 TaxID=3018102 RepID=UPI0022E4E98D|nr:gamma-glutamylcyclotransferase [Bacillus cereus group sp. Bc256]MDA2137850.1 gamma-glutamylcyclotransferase [Bacillus cereus group sp. Bc256]
MCVTNVYICLVFLKRYPAMICSNKDKLYGEVYEVNDAVLQKLDELEEYTGNAESDLYDRITETIYFSDREIRAFVYVAQDKEMLKKVIISGDWVEYQKGQ